MAPKLTNRWDLMLAPVLILVSTFLMLAVILFGSQAAVNLPSGLIYVVAVSSLSPPAIFLSGWSTRNMFSLGWAMRRLLRFTRV